MKTRLVLAIMILGVAVGVVSMASPREGVMVQDIIKSPSTYYNTTVVISGRVSEVKPIPEGAQSGLYFLKDSTDTPIAVATNQLPLTGVILSARGLVKFNADGPYLAEVRRERAIVTSSGKIVPVGEMPVLMIVLIVIGVLLVFSAVIVVVFVSRHGNSDLSETALDQAYCESCQATFSADQNFVVCPNCGSELKPLTGGILPSGKKKIRKKTMELSNAYFEITNGSNKGETYRLNIASDQLNVGRIDGGNDFGIDDDMVSKEHAKILFENDKFYIADRGSKNGTFVRKFKSDGVLEEEKFARREELIDGDQVRLGGTMLIFHRSK